METASMKGIINPEPYAQKHGYKIYPQITVAVLASLLMSATGTSLSWPAPSLPKLLEKSSEFHLTLDAASWIVSATLMSACLGPAISAALTDRIGRKWFVYLTGFPHMICWILIYFSESFESLFIARFVSGLSVGATFSTLPMYIGEIAEPRIRGFLNTMVSLSVSLGTVVTNATAPWVDIKTAALINMIPLIVFLVGFIWMPETPYYYAKKGCTEAAKKSLTWLRATPEVSEEMKEISDLIEFEKSQQGKVTELITIPSNRRANFIMWILFSAQQLSGMIVFLSYITLLLQKASVGVNPNILVLFISITLLFVSFVVVFIVDKIGRKPLLLLSSYGTSGCLLTIAIYFHATYFGMDTQSGLVRWVPLIAMTFFGISFALGLGPLVHVVLSEIYPLSIKASATMITSIYSSLLGAIVSKVYQAVTDAWGDHVIFYFFFVCEFILAFLILLRLPETKGKTFAEIQKTLGRDVHRNTTEVESGNDARY